ncbi:MAG: hypothetical protein WD577_12565 [Bacteroidales bacterium]
MRTGFIVLFLLLSFRSCYYVDSDRYEVEIVPEFTPQVQISSNLDGLDSILVSDSLLFSYSIEIDTGQLFLADIYLGNSLVFRSDTISDSLWLYSNYVSFFGNYELTLRAYYKSYSGSLADIFDAEYFVTDSSWILTFRE